MHPKIHAKDTLDEARVAIGQDFISLNENQLKYVRSEAAMAYERKHGKPMPADAESFIRKRYDLLQRRAARS